jgi:hypothetical protein
LSDVTKQKNLEEQLREGEERYRTIAEITLIMPSRFASSQTES